MSIIDKIKEVFHPEIYQRSMPVYEPVKLCLVTKGLSARYCLAVVELNERLSISTQVSKVRGTVRKLTSSFWLFRELGLYLVFITPKQSIDITEKDLPVDITGLHAVIAQGIYVIGPDKQMYNHSKWLNYGFGGAQDIAGKLAKLCEDR